MSKFVNPYNFVRQGRPAERREPLFHDWIAPGTLFGTLYCRLTARSPLFIPRFQRRVEGQHNRLEHFVAPDGRTPAIPASSLKGVIRSLAEAISNSCFALADRRRYPWLTKCENNQMLCPACRIFGFLEGRSVYRGNVRIGDAIAVADYVVASRHTSLPVLAGPKVEHRAWYDGAARAKMRKFYYHHANVRTLNDVPQRAQQDHLNVSVRLVERGTFRFKVDYRNLTPQELGLLIYASDPGDGLYHKVGMGKPIGLGTVRIEIIGLVEHNIDPGDPASRYHAFGGATERLLPEEAPEGERQHVQEQLQRRIAAFKRSYVNEAYTGHGNDLWAISEPNLQDLKEMLRLVDYPLRYPGRSWFDRYPDRRLPSVQEIALGEVNWLED